jgi:alkane 1-monooxygenase
MAWQHAWIRHLLAMSLPLVTLAYVLTGPWGIGALAWWSAPALLIWLDARSGEQTAVIDDPPLAPFDVLLVILAALQVGIVGIFVTRVAPASWADALGGGVLVGLNSGFSGITVAHELVHRPGWRHRLGRLLLVSVLYEHFSTEHVRGHHARVGTRDDPATARFGESFAAFRNRTIPAQLQSAWRLEARRLGDAQMALFDPRQLGNRVLHGAVASAGVVVATGVIGGFTGVTGLLVQAIVAIHLLEAVNWFEHWGIERRGARPETRDSWDTNSAVTLYALVGLSRHADHHAHATRPYPTLRPFDDSPKLPWGYLATGILALFDDRPIRARLEAELRRRRLGPFADT